MSGEAPKVRQTKFKDEYGFWHDGPLVSAENEPPDNPPEFSELSKDPPKFVIVPVGQPLHLHKPKDIKITEKDD